MNNFIDVMLKTIGIVFLLVLTLFMFSLLVEYVKMLWARHKFNKNMKDLNKQIDKAIHKVIKNNKDELNEEELQNALESLFKQNGNGNVKVDDVKIIKIDKEKKENN